jgi:hypothetical protein
MSLHEVIRGVARRATSSPWPFVMGEIVSYDPTTSFVVAQYDVVDRDGTVYQNQTPPSQLMMPWWGQGYGDQMGPEPGAQCVIAILDPQGNEFLVLGFTSNDLDPGFNTPSSERHILDKRGSFVWWSALRGGVLRIFGKGYATLFGTNGTEIGGENLNATNDAIITKTHLDAALAALTMQYSSEISAYLAANVSHGSGAPAITLSPVTSTGSSLARAVE